MKRTVIAIMVLAIVLTAVAAALAANPISLVVSGKEIKTDIPPRLIDGRVMVPIRFVAEVLGAEVKWDEKKNAVLIGNDIWDEQLNHSRVELYSAVTAVTSYLSLLQANIGGAQAGIIYESGTGVRGHHIGWNSVLSEKALDAGYGMERVWVPMGGMTGSSVRQIVRFEILDGRRVKDDQGRDAFEIAARYWLSDLTVNKPYKEVTKAYTVIREMKLNERGGGYMTRVVDNERTIGEKVLSEQPALWR